MLQEPITAGDETRPGSDPGPFRGMRLEGPWAALLAVASGVVLVPAFPPDGAWFLAPPAVAGLAVAAKGQRPAFGALLGAIAGLAFFLAHLRWSGVYVGALPWVALAVLETLFVAAMGALLTGVWRARDAVLRTGRPVTATLTAVAGTAGLWVAQEALRARVPFGGFPWGRLAFSQSDGPLARWAWLAGSPLVTAMVAVLGAALAVLAVTGLERRRHHGPRPEPGTEPGLRRPRAAAVTCAACLAVLPLAWALPVAAGPQPDDTLLRVAAVQGNVPEAGLDFNAERRAVLDNHVRGTIGLSERVAAGEAEQPDLVFWPENASDIDPLRNPDAAEVITAAVDAIGVPVLVGAVLREPAGYLSNAGIVWNPSDSAHPGPGVRYVKKHPAPFGEYIPYRSFFRKFSSKVDLVRTDFTPGRLSGALAMGPTTIGDVICFEVAYDGIVQQAVRDGARLLVVQTNNATFGYTAESVQQLAMSRLRAIETGRGVVHVSTVGVSAVYGPDGAELARSGHFTAEVLEATVPLRDRPTPAVRAGAAPEAVLALLGLAVAAGGFLVTRRSRDAAEPAVVHD